MLAASPRGPTITCPAPHLLQHRSPHSPAGNENRFLRAAGDHSGATSSPQHHVPVPRPQRDAATTLFVPNHATSCHPAQTCWQGRDRRARGQSHLHRDIPSIPLPCLHPRGGELTGGPVSQVMLGPGVSRSHTLTLEEMVHVANATVPSLLRTRNSVPRRVPRVLPEHWWGVWVHGPSQHSPSL